MPKNEKRNRAIKNEDGRASIDKVRPRTKNVLKDPETLTYTKGRKVENPARTQEKRNLKEDDFHKSKNVSTYQSSSVLVQSTTKPESRMTTFEKMEATRKGISKNELEELKKRAGLDYDQLSHILQVARATLIAKKGSEKFSALLSEKIMSVADIYSYGYDVFGSEEEFNQWIFQPIIALGGKSPYEILDNTYGREEVKHIIGRIEYGVYS